jgi:hypothetical protein
LRATYGGSSGYQIVLWGESEYNVLGVMNEREVRARIEQFLRATARNVVVPASLGLGLTASGCDSHAIRVGTADAGHDVVAQSSDAAASPVSDVRDATSDPFIGPAPPYLLPPPPPPPDAASATDLPLMAVPYLVALPPDAPVDQAHDALESESGAQGVDDNPDAYVSVPPPAYLPFMQQATELESVVKPAHAAAGESAALPAPQKKE